MFEAIAKALKGGDEAGALKQTNPFNRTPPFKVGRRVRPSTDNLTSVKWLDYLSLLCSYRSFANGGLKGVIATSGAHPLWWLLGY